MSAVVRFLFVIPLAFVLACTAASFALLWPFLQLPDGYGSDPVLLFQLATAFTIQAGQVGSAALLPWAVFMVVSEIAALRSLVLHALAGVAGGALAWRGLPGEAAGDSLLRNAMVAAGLAFAFVYWVVAGRRAGLWRRRSPSPASPVQPERPLP